MADDAKIEMQDGGRRACVYRARAADLVRLRDLPDLRYVFLIGGNPTPARVRVIAALPNLDAVSMDNGRLPPAAFPLLNALPPGTAIDVAIGKRHRVAWNVYYRRRLARLLRLPPDHRAAAAERFARGVTALGFKLADPTGRSVEIASCDASDDDLRLLRWAPRLETLHFHHGWGVSTAGLCHLAGHPTLRVLELNGVRFTGSLRVAARLPALEELSFFPDYDTPATDAHTAGLERATGLRRLEAHDGTFTEATLARVGRLAGLRRLKLPWIADAGDDGLRPLAGLHALEWLSIRNLPGVSAEWLRHVAGLTELRSLSLPIERGDGNGLRHLAGLPNLRFLSLRWGKGVTDAGLQHLAALPGLRVVAIGAGYLTRATRAGAAALAAALPNATVQLGDAVFRSPPPPVVRFRRQSVNEFASALIPADWVPQGEAGTWTEERYECPNDTWTLCLDGSSAKIRLWEDGDPAVTDAAGYLDAYARGDNGHRSKQFELGVVRVVAGEAATYRRHGRPCLAGVAVRDGRAAAVECTARDRQEARYRGLFRFVVASLRVGPDAAVEEEVTLPAEKLK